MKARLAILLLLFPICSYPLSYRSVAPVLHSVLDSPSRTNLTAGDDGWSSRVTAGPSQNDVLALNHRAFNRAHWRKRGIGLAVPGVCALAAGGVLLFTLREQALGPGTRTDASYQNLHNAGVILTSIGIAFLVAGLIVLFGNLGK